MTIALVQWVAEQCHGITEALNMIHHYQYSGKDGSLKAPDDKNYGRHGDIKPENILWFTQPSGPPVLKISDFGLVRFHSRDSASRDHPHQTPVSYTYRAPEYDITNGRLSPAYDLWTLGCLFTEFATWLLLGFQAVNDLFTEDRLKPSATRATRSGTAISTSSHPESWKEDTFFQIFENEAEVNPVVVQVRDNPP